MTTNRVALARLMGLKFVQLNGDGAAVDLALPLLRDHSTIVRRRAFDVLHLLSEENISANDAAQWEQWWKTNRTDFDRRHKTIRAP